MLLNRQRGVGIDIAPLLEFAEKVRGQLGFPAQAVSVQFVSDAAMSRLNWKFRKKRGPTDVLSFPAQQKRQSTRNKRAAITNAYAGDIAISPETAKRNARRDSRTLTDELRILLLHGMIHLAGYDHETDNGEMLKLEFRLRRRLGLSRS